MVSYSLHERTRRNVVVWVLISAFLAANAASFVAITYFQFDFGSNEFGIRWYSLTVFAAFFLIFNRYIWRISLVRQNLNIPDLNGIWVGTIDREEYPSRAMETGGPITVTIKQSFTSMAFTLENRVETSMSKATKSLSNNICLDGTSESGFILRESFHTGQFFGATVWQVKQEGYGASMVGSYVSGFPRTGKLAVTRVQNGHLYKTGLVQRMSSEDGEPYLGVAVSKECGRSYLRKLRQVRNASRVDLWSRNQIERDSGHCHLTVVGPKEFPNLGEAAIAKIENETVDYVLGDLGGVEMNDARTYYIIVASPHIAFLRKRAELGHRDLHVTLAFDPVDIHDVPKGVETKLV